MTTSRDFDDLRQRYESWSREDLLRVVHAASDYRPEAVEIAHAILATRQVPLDDAMAETVIADIETERATAKQAADEPLGKGLRVICFLFPGIPGIVIVAYQMSQRHTRKTNDAWTFVAYGWLARFVVVVFASL